MSLVFQLLSQLKKYLLNDEFRGKKPAEDFSVRGQFLHFRSRLQFHNQIRENVSELFFVDYNVQMRRNLRGGVQRRGRSLEEREVCRGEGGVQRGPSEEVFLEDFIKK